MRTRTWPPGAYPLLMSGEYRLHLSFFQSLIRSATLDRTQPPQICQRNDTRCHAAEMNHFVLISTPVGTLIA